jgi:hypothetical protein
MMAIQKSLAASGEQLAAGLAGLIGGRRAQAGVEAIWEVARGIAMLAEGSWPPNPAALIAAGLHFEAAAQYGIIAGTGSHRHSGAGAGAGGSGSSGRDYGRSGEGSGSDRMPQTLAQGAAGAGFSVWFRYFSRPWKLRYTCLGSSNGH